MFLEKILNKQAVGEIIRFGIVGVIATIIHYFIYWILQKWININIAFSIGYALSFICNFFLSSLFTFKSKVTVRKGVGFGGAHLINWLIQLGLLNMFVYIGVSRKWAPILVYAISIPINFIMVRFVFKRNTYSSKV